MHHAEARAPVCFSLRATRDARRTTETTAFLLSSISAPPTAAPYTFPPCSSVSTKLALSTPSIGIVTEYQPREASHLQAGRTPPHARSVESAAPLCPCVPSRQQQQHHSAQCAARSPHKARRGSTSAGAESTPGRAAHAVRPHARPRAAFKPVSRAPDTPMRWSRARWLACISLFPRSSQRTTPPPWPPASPRQWVCRRCVRA